MNGEKPNLPVKKEITAIDLFNMASKLGGTAVLNDQSKLDNLPKIPLSCLKSPETLRTNSMNPPPGFFTKPDVIDSPKKMEPSKIQFPEAVQNAQQGRLDQGVGDVMKLLQQNQKATVGLSAFEPVRSHLGPDSLNQTNQNFGSNPQPVLINPFSNHALINQGSPIYRMSPPQYSNHQQILQPFLVQSPPPYGQENIVPVGATSISGVGIIRQPLLASMAPHDLSPTKPENETLKAKQRLDAAFLSQFMTKSTVSPTHQNFHAFQSHGFNQPSVPNSPLCALNEEKKIQSEAHFPIGTPPANMMSHFSEQSFSVGAPPLSINNQTPVPIFPVGTPNPKISESYRLLNIPTSNEIDRNSVLSFPGENLSVGLPANMGRKEEISGANVFSLEHSSDSNGVIGSNFQNQFQSNVAPKSLAPGTPSYINGPYISQQITNIPGYLGSPVRLHNHVNFGSPQHDKFQTITQPFSVGLPNHIPNTSHQNQHHSQVPYINPKNAALNYSLDLSATTQQQIQHDPAHMTHMLPRDGALSSQTLLNYFNPPMTSQKVLPEGDIIQIPSQVLPDNAEIKMAPQDSAEMTKAMPQNEVPEMLSNKSENETIDHPQRLANLFSTPGGFNFSFGDLGESEQYILNNFIDDVPTNIKE